MKYISIVAVFITLLINSAYASNNAGGDLNKAADFIAPQIEVSPFELDELIGQLEVIRDYEVDQGLTTPSFFSNESSQSNEQPSSVDPRLAGLNLVGHFTNVDGLRTIIVQDKDFKIKIIQENPDKTE